MKIVLARNEIVEYMNEAVQNLGDCFMEPITATVEDSEKDGVWTFKLTYKLKE
jgi:hypothetical protein